MSFAQPLPLLGQDIDALAHGARHLDAAHAMAMALGKPFPSTTTDLLTCIRVQMAVNGIEPSPVSFRALESINNSTARILARQKARR